MGNGGYVLMIVLVASAPALVLASMRPDRISRRGPNTFIGIRTSATMRSDAAWREGHDAAWPLVRGGSILTVVVLLAGAVLVALVVTPPAVRAVASAVVVGALLLWLAVLVPAAVRAHRVAARTPSQR